MLFMHRIWRPIIEESTPSLPLSAKDFRDLIQESSVRWKRLGIETAEGNIVFKEMEENVRLLADPQLLSDCHLDGLPVLRSNLAVLGAYHDFKTLRDIRHVIKPFVAALRYFTIVDKQPIETMYTFVTENLLLKWDETKLADVRRTGIIKTLENYFNIDPERPETKSTLEFISSLVTDEDQSPLIEWLRNKTEQDMEAMGRILQGNLLEAYGMLQTLKTRIAPFFIREFQSYNDLLRVLSESEKNFAARVNRVQAIDPKFLVNILPEIEAAVRAAVISPYEDAREKLSKLSRLSIQPKEDGHTVKIVLAPTGSLTLEDLQQAFQLLEMSAMDDRIANNNEEWVQQTRETVVLVFRLCDLFQDLLASGCITYTFRGLDISLTELDFHIQERKEQLRVWNEHLKRMQDMPHLELFSREYLLHLADLVYQSQTEQVISILRMFLPLASKQLEKLAAQLVRRFSRSAETDTEWLTTEQLFDLLRELHEIIEVVFHKTSPEQEIPPFLVVYGRNLLTHFLDKSVQILNVPRESVVGCALAAYLAVTRRSIDPSRILFITANTGTEEVSRFMTLWSVGNPENDFFIMVHIERLSTVAASAVRDTVARVVPERRTKLLLLAQHHCQIQATKSLGARLGIVSDRMLEINFTTSQLREYLSRLLPRAVNIHFFTSKYPGCGKSQQIMRMATHPIERKSPAYYR
jgi:E3 ubiquitin-protein ligase RNF213